MCYWAGYHCGKPQFNSTRNLWGQWRSHLRNISPKVQISWGICQLPLLPPWHRQPDSQVNQRGSGIQKKPKGKEMGMWSVGGHLVGLRRDGECLRGIGGTNSVCYNRHLWRLGDSQGSEKTGFGHLMRTLCKNSVGWGFFFFTLFSP